MFQKMPFHSRLPVHFFYRDSVVFPFATLQLFLNAHLFAAPPNAARARAAASNYFCMHCNIANHSFLSVRCLILRLAFAARLDPLSLASYFECSCSTVLRSVMLPLPI